MKEDYEINANQIETILPHRYPFLLVDKVLDYKDDLKITALKNISINEDYFNGHFPGNPVMPGVLIVEALAQAGAILVLMKAENKGKLAYFAGIDNLRFKRQVVPGDQLILEIEVLKLKSSVGKCKATATVNGEIACQGELMFMIS